jgi:ribokinase
MDRLYLVERIGAPGEELIIDSASEQPGGSAANTIVGLARLGVKTGFIGVVGDDSDGACIRSGMAQEGVNVSGIETADCAGRTGMVLVIVDGCGERSMYVYSGANNALNLTSKNLLYANSAKFLHLSSFACEDQFEMQMEFIDRSEARISFAPGMLYARRGIDALHGTISQTEIVFLNRDEIGILTGSEYRDGAKELNDIGAAIVAVTLGGDGCYIRTKGGGISVPASSAEVVDTTGAGDAFCAGFLCGLLSGRSLDYCGRMGNRVAAKCVEAVGARTGLPRQPLHR